MDAKTKLTESAAVLDDQEDRLATALEAVINSAGVDGAKSLRAMRRVSEKIIIANDGADAAFERVRLRSLGAGDELRNAEGGGLSDALFASHLGLRSRETIRQYRAKGLIFGWLKDSRSYRYPAWQIYNKELLSGLDQVLATLKEKELRPLGIISYFVTRSRALGDARPLDMLRQGKVSEVVQDAARYGDIGAI